MPGSDNTPTISLREGNNPLIPARNLLGKLGFNGEIHLKFEGMNPASSFKDRGMTMAVSKAAKGGSRTVICASTWNISAYVARAGKCIMANT
jgi:threonine synthase